MNFTQYSIFSALRYIICAVIFSISSTTFLSQAQLLTSKAMAKNMELFIENRRSDREKAREYAELILADLDSTVIGEDVGMLYDFMSEYNETIRHNYTEALTYRLRAASIYEAINNTPCMARTHALLSRIYMRNHDYHNAFSYSIKALEGGRQVGDSTTVREAYLALEQVDFFYNHNQQRAMGYNKRVSESYDNREQAHQAARALNNRFNYDLTPDSAIITVARCEEICAEYGFNDILINVYLNMAMQQFVFNNLEKTEYYLDKAKPLISNFKEEGYYYSALGFYHLNIGNNKQAIEALKRSIELLNEGDFDTKNVHSYFLLQDIYYNQGRFQEAYDALMAFAETYTRQHNSQNVVELSKLINELEIERNQEEHRRQQEHNKLITLFYILSIVVILIVVFLLLSRFRLERRNRELQRTKTEQELNHKNEIIKIQQLQQFQEKNNIDSLSEELGKIATLGNIKEMQSPIRRIIQQLQSNTKSGVAWAEVEKTLAEGNNVFYENLLRNFPNLTKNERKLCLFIHMKMSTKEISDLTHQSLGSINVARSRLRQKFGLTGDDTSLIAFLDQYNTQQPAE